MLDWNVYWINVYAQSTFLFVFPINKIKRVMFNCQRYWAFIFFLVVGNLVCMVFCAIPFFFLNFSRHVMIVNRRMYTLWYMRIFDFGHSQQDFHWVYFNFHDVFTTFSLLVASSIWTIITWSKLDNRFVLIVKHMILACIGRYSVHYVRQDVFMIVFENHKYV